MSEIAEPGRSLDADALLGTRAAGESLLGFAAQTKGFFEVDSAISKLANAESTLLGFDTSSWRLPDVTPVVDESWFADIEQSLDEANERRYQVEEATIASAERLEKLTAATLELSGHVQRLHEQQAASSADEARRWRHQRRVNAAGVLLALVAAATGVLQLL